MMTLYGRWVRDYLGRDTNLILVWEGIQQMFALPEMPQPIIFQNVTGVRSPTDMMQPESSMVRFPHVWDHHRINQHQKDSHQICGSQCVRRCRIRWHAILIILMGLATHPVDLIAQRNESEARTLAGSLASVTFNLGWPTATFEGYSFGHLQQVSGGFDVSVRLHGKSALGEGTLWMNVVLELRNGVLTNLRVDDHNAAIFAPFASVQLFSSVIADILRDQRDEALLIGTWQDESNIYTYSENKRVTCVGASPCNADGDWTIRNRTLTVSNPDAHMFHFAVEFVDQREHRIRDLQSGMTRTARRVNYSTTDAERLAATYDRIGIAFVTVKQVDSALVFFGAAESTRHPQRLAELQLLLQSSPLYDATTSVAERRTYEQRIREMLTSIVPSDVLASIPSGSAGEMEDALEMMLPPYTINVAVTSRPPGMAVRYRVRRSNPYHRPGPYAPIITDTTFVHERAKIQFCYLDPTGHSRGAIVPCQKGCMIQVPLPVEWTESCEDS
jgi:hypothetical protein